jgi:hypothetical protein
MQARVEIIRALQFNRVTISSLREPIDTQKKGKYISVLKYGQDLGWKNARGRVEEHSHKVEQKETKGQSWQIARMAQGLFQTCLSRESS